MQTRLLIFTILVAFMVSHVNHQASPGGYRAVMLNHSIVPGQGDMSGDVDHDDFNWETAVESEVIIQAPSYPVSIAYTLPVSLFVKLFSNPSLFDLPPPEVLS